MVAILSGGSYVFKLTHFSIDVCKNSLYFIMLSSSNHFYESLVIV